MLCMFLFLLMVSFPSAAFATDDWRQVMGNGFGDRNNRSVGEFHVFKGRLYASTLRNPMTGAGELWRSSDGVSWTEVTSFTPPIPATQTIGSMADSGGSDPQYMYAGTIAQAGAALLYRSTDGTTWTPITGIGSGFASAGNTLISPHPVVKDGFLYIGTQNEAGGQLWRRPINDSAQWTKVLDFSTIDSNLKLVTYLYLFNGTIYASVANFGGQGGVLYQSTNGTTWTRNGGVGNGFGNRNNIAITSMADFNGFLYAATKNVATGGEVWRSQDGSTWQSVASNGFGSALNEENHNIRVAHGRLWVATMDRSPAPFRVFSTSDGVTFTQSNVDGFGDPNNTNTSQGTATLVVEFGNSVYWAGQNTVTGAQIWRFTPPVPTPFTITNRGALSRTTEGSAGTATIGYARVQPGSGSTTPSGLAIFGFRQKGILVSEAAVPATQPIQSGRIYAEVDGPVNTGVAIANPGSQTATVSFFFTDTNGQSFGTGSTTISAGSQIAAFLNQAPFNGGASIRGTFTFNSSVPVSVIALRGFTNEEGQFLITTLPVADLATAVVPDQSLVFSHYADGGGWSTQIVLVNPGDPPIGGSVQFLNQSGQISASSGYSIAANSSQVVSTSGAGATTAGSVRIVPSSGGRPPAGLLIFSFRQGNVTVAQAGVPAIAPGSAFRVYAETSGISGQTGSIQTGVAIANSGAASATITFELTNLSGASTGLTGTTNLPANGQTAMFLDQIPGFSGLTAPFQGILRISSSTNSISVVGLRTRLNEQQRFLVTTTSPSNESAPTSTTETFFPHFVDGGGYTTQFILFSGSAGQTSSGNLRFFSQSSQELSLTLH